MYRRYILARSEDECLECDSYLRLLFYLDKQWKLTRTELVDGYNFVDIFVVVLFLYPVLRFIYTMTKMRRFRVKLAGFMKI